VFYALGSVSAAVNPDQVARLNAAWVRTVRHSRSTWSLWLEPASLMATSREAIDSRGPGMLIRVGPGAVV
jgi:hypothetical protein